MVCEQLARTAPERGLSGSVPDAIESKLVFEEIGDPRFGPLADHLIRPEPVDLIAGEAQHSTISAQTYKERKGSFTRAPDIDSAR